MTVHSSAEEPTSASGDSPKQRADQVGDRVFRGMLLAFGAGFLVLALVEGILTGEVVAPVVLFALIYGLMVIFARWGRRLLMQGTDKR